MTNLNGAVVVVTGGGSGIGRSLAVQSARRGGSVVVVDIEAAAAEAVAGEISASGGSAIAAACDVSDLDSVEELAKMLDERFGRVNLLCNNAGVVRGGTLGNTAPSDFRWIFEVNVFGTFYGIRGFLPLLRDAARRGELAHVLNTGSEHSLGLPPVGAASAYTATKHALLGLSDALRRDEREAGIGVSLLCPANVATNLWDSARNRPPRLGGPQRGDPEVGKQFATKGPHPDVTASIALDGVEAGQFLIPSDQRMREFVRARVEEVLASLETIPDVEWG